MSWSGFGSGVHDNQYLDSSGQVTRRWIKRQAPPPRSRAGRSIRSYLGVGRRKRWSLAADLCVMRTLGGATMGRVRRRPALAALVWSLGVVGCHASGPSDASGPSTLPTTLEIRSIDVTVIPCPMCTGDSCPPVVCRPQYFVAAELWIQNPSMQTIQVRSVRLELRQSNGTPLGGGAPTAGQVPASIPGASHLNVGILVRALPGASVARTVLRADAHGVDEAGTPWQATVDAVVPEQ
jgi:hypothetical protein